MIWFVFRLKSWRGLITAWEGNLWCLWLLCSKTRTKYLGIFLPIIIRLFKKVVEVGLPLTLVREVEKLLGGQKGKLTIFFCWIFCLTILYVLCIWSWLENWLSLCASELMVKLTNYVEPLLFKARHSTQGDDVGRDIIYGLFFKLRDALLEKKHAL